MPPDQLFRQSQLQTHAAHFVFEEVPQWLDQLKPQLVRQAADVVVGLDGRGGAVGISARFDHVGIERSLRQKPRVRNREGLVAKHFDEHAANNFAFLLRVGNAGQLRQEPLARIGDMQIGFEVATETILDLFRLPLPQESVIHKDAGELRSDRAEQQSRRHRRINPAGQSADDAALPHVFTDRLDFPLDQRADPPGSLATANLPDEVT